MKKRINYWLIKDGHQKSKVIYRLNAILLIGVILFSLLEGIAIRSISKVEAATTLGNPRIDSDGVVTWDCVYFGNYPQAEIVASIDSYTAIETDYLKEHDLIEDANLYEQLATSTGWDENGDIIIGNSKYRRILMTDATRAVTNYSDSYNWEDDATYHYFIYEPIKWRVLEVADDKALLLSDITIDDQKYIFSSSVMWETTSIRSWLNGYDASSNILGEDYSKNNFLQSGFSNEEQMAIEPSMIESQNGTDSVSDKCFLLSSSDIENYNYGFSDECSANDVARRSNSSTYAKAMGLSWPTSGNYVGLNTWWLRRSFSGEKYIYIDAGGSLYNFNFSGSDFRGVRPALYLNLNDIENYSYAGTTSLGNVNVSEGENEITTEEDSTDTETTEEKITDEKITEVPTFDKKMKSKIDVSDYTKGVDLGKDTIHGPKLNILGKEVELFSLSANVELNIADKVTYCQNTDDKTIEVLIGVESKDGKVDFSDEANSDRYWKETYKQVKSIYTGLTGNKKTKKLYNDFRSLRKKLHSTNSTLLVKGEVKSVIFLKYSYATGELELVEGGGLVSAELGADVKKKIPQFPVAYITVGASASGQVSFNVVPAWSGEIGIDLSLKAGAGIDLKYANIEGGAKVTLSNTLQLPASSIENALSVKVNGKGYLKAKAFGKTLANASKDFVNLSIYPELSLQTMSLLEPQALKSSISSNEDETIYVQTMTAQETSEAEFLKTNLYPDCAPSLTKLGSNQYLLVWVDDNGTKDTYNNTSLLYSYFDGSEWSSPAVIVESAYLNDYPTVYSKDGTAYILWQQLTQICDSETTYEEMLSCSDLYYITFTEGTFSEPVAVTADNTVYEMQQQIYVTDDEVYFVWVENSANNPFMGEGETNTIYMRELSDENSESIEIDGDLSSVTNLTIGEVEGVLSVGYTEGTDGYLYQNGESIQLNDDENAVRNIQIIDGIMYAGLNDSLCVYEEEEFSDTGLAFTGDYTVLSDGNRIISNVYEGGPSKLVLFSKLDEGWNNGVVLTDETKYIRDYQIVEEEDGTLKSVICEVDVDLDSEDIYGTADLLVKDLSADADIELLDTVYTDKDNPVPGEELTFSYEIANNGEETIDEYTISLLDSIGVVIGEETVEMEVDGGTTKEGEVTFVMLDDIALENYELVINSDSDVVSSNNSVQMTLGYSDLSIVDCQISQDGMLSGKIVNEGYADAQNVVLKVYKDNIDTTPIKEMSFDAITSGESLDISTTFSEDEMVVAEGSLGTTWLLEVETESEESGYGNNTTIVFLYRELQMKISENIEMKQGDSAQIAFNDTLTNEDFSDKAIWSSKDETIATVDETGEVKGISVGDTEVYAMFDNKVYMCKVSVKTTQESNEQPSSTQQPTTEEQSGENSQTTEDTSTTQESNKTKGLPKVGTKVATSSAEYKVTKSSTKMKEVTFIKPKSSKKKSITVPEAVTINGYTYKVTAIANKAFKNNKKLKSVTIGKNVKKIGKEAFYNCKKLKKITIKSAVLKSVGKNAIKGIHKKATIKVPKKQLKKYKKLFKSKTGYKKTMKIKK